MSLRHAAVSGALPAVFGAATGALFGQRRGVRDSPATLDGQTGYRCRMHVQATASSLAGHAHETIESVADLERTAERGLSMHQRWIERVTSAVGRPLTVYITLGFVVAWIAVNTALTRFARAFDPPPFTYLDGLISLMALLMTIFILTRENRTNLHDARRDRLDLQINLLNERKISKVIAMIEELRRDSPTIPNRHDPEAREMRQSADPEAIVRAMDERTPDA